MLENRRITRRFHRSSRYILARRLTGFSENGWLSDHVGRCRAAVHGGCHDGESVTGSSARTSAVRHERALSAADAKAMGQSSSSGRYWKNMQDMSSTLPR